MSRDYPFRPPPSDSDLRPDPRRHGAGAEPDFYRQPAESFSSSSSSRSGGAAPGPQDSVLSLLSSCGLEPEDLSLLAKLPEDVLTVESLPHILNQIKGKKEAFAPRSPPRHFPQRPGALQAPPPSFKPLSSARWPPAGPASRDWEDRRPPVRYPLRVPSPPAPPESQRDRWPGRRPAARSPPPFPSRRAVDRDLRPRAPAYGREASSFGAAGPLDRTRPPRFSGSADRKAPPPLGERRHESKSAPGSRAPGALPSKKQALDFHGTLPAVFPYSCSLCDITVLSEKTWTQHVNATVHADGQLNLLQRFPSWDCRLERVGSDDDPPSQWKEAPRQAAATSRTSQNRDPQTSKKQQKASDKGKVVCAKFPPQSVEEAGLRKLIEPFGKIGKILMFPSLAFVEMGSCDQAKDLVKFYSSSDKAAGKEKVEFSISNAFSFLQSSQVVSFTPAPTGEDGRSDLLSIAKRFGEPLYTLFLPSQAFVEMKVSAEAQKMVDFYSCSALRINGATIQVAFSSEYRTLMRVPSAQKYEEEPSETRESSRDQRTGSRDGSREGRRKRSGSGDGKGKGSRTRSRSREKSRTRSSQQKRSKSKERDSTGSPKQSQSEKKPKEPENSGPVLLPCSEEPQKEEGVSIKTQAAEEEEEMGDEDRSTADESDIEGMEVIAEDEDNLDSLEEDREQRERPEPPAAEEQKLEEKEEQPELLEEEAEFPLDLENCITLDELQSDDEDEGPPADGDSEGSGRVLFFSAMPPQFADSDFIAPMRRFGTVVRYLLIQNRQQGFVEMSTSSEALKAAEELRSKPVYVSGTRIIGTLAQNSSGLANGWPVPEEESGPAASEPDQNTRSRRDPEEELCQPTGETSETGLETPGTAPEPLTPSPELEARSHEATETSGKVLEERASCRTGSRTVEQEAVLNPETSAEGPETPENGSDDESRRRREPASRTAPDAPKRKGSEVHSVPAKTLRTQEAAEQPDPTSEPEADREKNPEPQADANNPESPEPPEQEAGPAAPAEGATEPQRPAEPVGVEFVRPVVGYFCHLCQLIFSDEDEAKLQHCSTPAHYSKYQEKTGRETPG
ncbi:matrin 3-like 1.1 isoform X2 [Fundulus heteroclitus]|uniref:matrin 3-like 1.1 isoform X2 n=1 Tax=Fundulus heteroclitus TaxID=8078 RepID=UPI00165BB1D2|nr:matrin 3-like 1.1 isoform X2 [Fundulus heteroclitus]